MDKTLVVEKFTAKDDRPVVAVGLGPRIVGAAAPKPNPGNTHTNAWGAMYRFGRDIPKPQYSRKYKRQFREFVWKFLFEELEPLSFDTDLSVESWLKIANYSDRRKKQLQEIANNTKVNLCDLPLCFREHKAILDVWEDLQLAKQQKDVRKLYRLFTQPNVLKAFKSIHNNNKRLFDCKSFPKDETYVDYKHTRAINSRSDEYKVLVAPAVQKAGDRVMHDRPEFIKYCEFDQKAPTIKERLNYLGQRGRDTDYTSFEAHFDREFIQDCEMQMLIYMFLYLPNGLVIVMFLFVAKCGQDNRCVFKFFVLKINGKRMSGEMDTSLSNGFSNMMFLYFSCWYHGINYKIAVIAFFEGDDCLCFIFGNVPDAFFKEFGLTVKISYHDKIERASFCGMVFDLDEMKIVTDIVDALVNFGWTTAPYFTAKDSTLKSIIRCKALSMAYQYKDCPILSVWSLKFIRMTQHYSIAKLLNDDRRHTNTYYLEVLQRAEEYFRNNGLDPKISMKTRLLVEDVYGITVADQLQIESDIDEIDSFDAFFSPTLDKYIPKVFRDYNDQYVLPRSTRAVNATDLLFPKINPTLNMGVYYPA